MLPTPTAILFDWDNTLVDTWPIIHRALHDTFVEYGMEPWTLEEVRERVGRSMREAFPGLFGEDWEAAGERYLHHYRARHLEQLHPLAGAAELLEALTHSPVPVGVVSNKTRENLRKEITHLGWDTYFDAAVGSGDATQDKPHPAPILLALSHMGVESGPGVWFVGDSTVDLECAENSGITALLYGPLTPDSDGNGGMRCQTFPVHHHAPDYGTLTAAFRDSGIFS